MIVYVMIFTNTLIIYITFISFLYNQIKLPLFYFIWQFIIESFFLYIFKIEENKVDAVRFAVFIFFNLYTSSILNSCRVFTTFVR